MSTLREMQLEIVEMIKVIDSVFEQNEIRYLLLGGSVLGAVRHGGFIPWDDDVDIGIFREDFDKAESLLKNLSSYVYENAEKHIVPDLPCGHLHLVNDLYPIDNSPTIDVFALDYIPEDKNVWKELRFYAYIHHVSVLRRAPRNRGLLPKILIGTVLFFIPNKIWDIIQKKSLEKVLAYARGKKDFIGNIWGYWTEKEYFPANIYENTVKAKFENLMLPIPSEYDVYLTQMYGNYMELPPEEKRVPKHRSF